MDWKRLINKSNKKVGQPPIFIKSNLSLSIFLQLIFSTNVIASESKPTLHLAVAANFLPTAKLLANQFNKDRTVFNKDSETPSQKNIDFIFSSGSTGSLYQQIVNGAPYQVFLAADHARPKALEQKGFIIPKTRTTYGFGKLVLWGQNLGRPDRDSNDSFAQSLQFWISTKSRFTFANPKTAPYGLAATEVLSQVFPNFHYENKQSLHAVNRKSKKPIQWVLGNSVSQTMQYTSMGYADFGFIPLSHLTPSQKSKAIEIPEFMYSKLDQQLVLIDKNIGPHERDIAFGFYHYILSDIGQAIIEKNGYKPVMSGNNNHFQQAIQSANTISNLTKETVSL